MNKEQILKLFKNKNNRVILIIFIIGVVLMVITGVHSSPKEKRIGGEAQTAMTLSEEERLAEILSEIKGAGRVSVMITYYSSAEKSLAYETKTASREERGELSEDRKAVTAGGEPMVVKEVYPRVKGVIITADGAGVLSVKAAICEAAAAALDVPAHRICVFKKEE